MLSKDNEIMRWDDGYENTYNAALKYYFYQLYWILIDVKSTVHISRAQFGKFWDIHLWNHQTNQYVVNIYIVSKGILMFPL